MGSSPDWDAAPLFVARLRREVDVARRMMIGQLDELDLSQRMPSSARRDDALRPLSACRCSVAPLRWRVFLISVTP